MHSHPTLQAITRISTSLSTNTTRSIEQLLPDTCNCSFSDPEIEQKRAASLRHHIPRAASNQPDHLPLTTGRMDAQPIQKPETDKKLRSTLSPDLLPQSNPDSERKTTQSCCKCRNTLATSRSPQDVLASPKCSSGTMLSSVASSRVAGDAELALAVRAICESHMSATQRDCLSNSLSDG